MGSFGQRITSPMQLPPALTRWLPKSFTVALGAVSLLVLWSLPLFAPAVYPYVGQAVRGWQLKTLIPWNAAVPLSAALLLMTAWTGDRRAQLWWLLALWLQASGIAICVPLAPYPHAAWLYLTLFVISISWIRDSILGSELERGGSLKFSLRLRAGLIAVAIALLLWVPYVMSRMFVDRWDNPLFAGMSKILGHERPAAAAQQESLPRVAPGLNSPRATAPTSVPASAMPKPMIDPPATVREIVPAQMPSACNAEGEWTLQGLRTAWDDSFSSGKVLNLAEVDETRARLVRKLVDVRLGGPIRVGLGPNLDSALATASMLYAQTPESGPDLRAPPSLAWLRPIAARYIAAYSFAGVKAGTELESLETATGSGTPPLRLFPVGLGCEHLVQPGRFAAANWIYPRIVAGAAAPATVVAGDDETLIQFEPASMVRVAGVVDFARFVGAPVKVELMNLANADDEIYPANPAKGPRTPTWSLAVKTDLPAFIVQSGTLIPGRLVRAVGGDVCRDTSPGFEIVTREKVQGTVDGFILSGSDANRARLSLVDATSSEMSRDIARRMRHTIQFDLNADTEPELTFMLSRFQWRGYDEDSPWHDSPSYRARVIYGAATASVEADAVSYVSCEPL
jgi:hypothetical protein